MAALHSGLERRSHCTVRVRTGHDAQRRPATASHISNGWFHGCSPLAIYGFSSLPGSVGRLGLLWDSHPVRSFTVVSAKTDPGPDSLRRTCPSAGRHVRLRRA
eukprot:scaffold82194_cov36-Phaeocystis_antarctica.AAC.1